MIHGEGGVSQKAAGVGKSLATTSASRASMLAGRCASGRTRLEVDGTAWMDHEYSTDSMGADQAGWDWMSVQLDDGRDFDAVPHAPQRRLGRPLLGRDLRGSERRSSLHLRADEFTMTPGERWASPSTGGRYPLEWRIEVPSLDLRLRATTPLETQEITPKQGRGPAYWEGAVDYVGDGVKGVGYLEMTGYDRTLQLGIPGDTQAAP